MTQVGQAQNNAPACRQTNLRTAQYQRVAIGDAATRRNRRTFTEINSKLLLNNEMFR